MLSTVDLYCVFSWEQFEKAAGGKDSWGVQFSFLCDFDLNDWLYTPNVGRWFQCFGHMWTDCHYFKYLANQKVSWRLWLSQRGPEWWVVGTNGSLSKWLPWSAGRLPGSPVPRCAGSSHSSALTNHSCSAPGAHQAGADLMREGKSACVTKYCIRSPTSCLHKGLIITSNWGCGKKCCTICILMKLLWSKDMHCFKYLSEYSFAIEYKAYIFMKIKSSWWKSF